MAVVPLRDRLSFLSRLPTVIKGTSDDEVPCPGYLFEEIAKISHESAGSSHCLLEYLLNRLQNNSCHVKLKVLKILLYMCNHGSSHFLLQLKRNSSFIQEAAVFAGPPDPLHGNSLYQKVRVTAQDLASALFSDALLPQTAAQTPKELPSSGMGSRPSPHGSLQGFGFERSSSTSTGKVLLATIQKAAEVVANAVLPGQELASPHHRELKDDAYEPVMAPSGKSSILPTKPSSVVAHEMRVNHQPGQAGGGWEELDSGQSSQDSLQENSELSRTSDSYSKSGSDNNLGALESGSVAERMEAENLGDCLQEVSLVTTLTQGSKVFLTREETQHFIKECGLLNCEVVLAMLNRTLKDPSECIRMRAMCAIYSLMCSDLLSHDQIFAITQQHLQELSQESPGSVANKATKILRQFEALCRSHPTPKDSPPVANHCVPTKVTFKRTDDLLTDTTPLTGEAILKPMSLAAQPSQEPEVLASDLCLLEGQMLGSASCGQLGLLPPPGLCQHVAECKPPDSEPQEDRLLRGDPDGTVSLFAGMELVAPSSMTLADASEKECVPLTPRTSCIGSTMDNEDSQERSAFPFLNV
ncbi:AP-4 complex accessory subunit tepsin isoform X2 [Hemicordylus capensis]|uniref:AP-4 complex accessory subunit tepsin isoform X2 n=1 Tax=Hemicordylus capensis TaxID=884348 RepID=UPI0023029E77|nr:AP-4 complex accessory subunit tepsin isoform X2 [Hemicordylus capensis]